jgi:hypothetical protein
MEDWQHFTPERMADPEYLAQLNHGGRPVPNIRVEYPPVKDAVDRVLCVRLPGQVFENFRRRRGQFGVGEVHLGRLALRIAH